MRFFTLNVSVFLLSFLAIYNSNAQQIYSGTIYPLSDFQAPLAIYPPALSGSFGELRANHFHSGLDYRTQQRTGFPVYAVADGYVSRLRAQNSGFGYALYINHPNGYTSVYAHLLRYNPRIAQIVKTQQYENKSYELDQFPDKNLIPVRKGEIIAYSGNSGSSGGPHLHFEIRDTKTEATINPQLLGINIPDNIAPVIHAMYVYRLNGQAFNEFTPKQYFQITGGNGNYKLNQVNTIHLSGEVGFGVVVNDKHNGASGNNGVYAIELKIDHELVYASAVERFTFGNSRAINSHIDYPTYLKTKQTIQKSFVDPGNPIEIYYKLKNRGRVIFNDGKAHAVEYIISDAKGNKSYLKFQVLADEKAIIPTPAQETGILMNFDKTNEFNTDEIKIILPKGTLYDNLNFTYHKTESNSPKSYSSLHYIHNKLTPLHQGFEIWIKPSINLGEKATKAVIVNQNNQYQGGVTDKEWIKANPKSFGTFSIQLDTMPPTIVPLNISANKNMSEQSQIKFKISDALSGIKQFNGYIDGKWILMEFDAKTANLVHNFDERTSKGKHKFELIVSDMKDNERKYSAEFYR